MRTLGLDIGGANLKAATSDGAAVSTAFPLWKSPDGLAGELKSLAARLPDFSRLAVTMTGELADCFETKAEGVSSILSAVESLADGRPIGVWSVNGEFLATQAARNHWSLVAAANWHALATWASRFIPEETGLLIDIGSTTTDIIPLIDGKSSAQGRSDLGRLLHGELIYTGIRRTPLCAVASSVQLRGAPCPLAAELFATSLDLYLITGQIASSSTDLDTADGRPATTEHAFNRLAHLLCCDRTEVTLEELQSIAHQLAAAQKQTISHAINRVLARLPLPPSTIILSGSGTFLTREILQANPPLAAARAIDLSDELSISLAEAACAYAVATLLAENPER